MSQASNETSSLVQGGGRLDGTVLASLRDIVSVKDRAMSKIGSNRMVSFQPAVVVEVSNGYRMKMNEQQGEGRSRYVGTQVLWYPLYCRPAEFLDTPIVIQMP
jgi:hypothetical protein